MNIIAKLINKTKSLNNFPYHLFNILFFSFHMNILVSFQS